MNRTQEASWCFQSPLPQHGRVAVVPGRVLLVIGFVGCQGCPSLRAVDGREAPWGSTVLQSGGQQRLAPAVSHSHEHFLATDLLEHPLPCFHVHFCSFRWGQKRDLHLKPELGSQMIKRRINIWSHRKESQWPSTEKVHYKYGNFRPLRGSSRNSTWWGHKHLTWEHLPSFNWANHYSV